MPRAGRSFTSHPVILRSTPLPLVAAGVITSVVTACAVGTVTPSVRATGLVGNVVTTTLGSGVPTAMKALSGVSTTTGTGLFNVSAVNVQTVCNSFRISLMCGLHALGPSVIRNVTAKDTFKIAIYFSTATRGPGDTIYTSAGEVTGTNYVAGGIALTNTIDPLNNGSVAFWTPSGSATFSNVTISTAFDTILLYNFTSVSKLAIGVFVFGPQTINAGNFTVQFSPNDMFTGLIRLT